MCIRDRYRIEACNESLARGYGRDGHSELRALARCAGEIDVPTVLLGHLLNNEEAHTGAFCSFGGEEVLEDFLAELLGNTGPVVLHLEYRCAVLVLRTPQDYGVVGLAVVGIESASINGVADQVAE